MKSILFFLLLLTLNPSFAAGGTGRYFLDWGKKGESLLYWSCGGADACWVAEVRVGRGMRRRLRCDGESLWYLPEARGKEIDLQQGCTMNDSPEKPHLIRQKLEELSRTR